MNKIDLKGRNAIVTGGAQGFGLAITKRFLESGANVIVWDIDESIFLEAQKIIDSENLYFDKVNVIENTEVKKGVDNAIDKLRKIDIFVNNAGITGPNETTWNYPIEEWNKVIDVDLNGVFYCSKNITPHMIENNYGKIINIASIAGKEGNPNAAINTTHMSGIGLYGIVEGRLWC